MRNGCQRQSVISAPPGNGLGPVRAEQQEVKRLLAAWWGWVLPGKGLCRLPESDPEGMCGTVGGVNQAWNSSDKM